jgi:cysteine-rich repeat protein
MRRESLPLLHPGLAPLLTVTLLALPLQSCLKPTSVDCGPDFACPAGMKCAASQNLCIEDDCGDGVVQSWEACDDGNVLSKDGCSADCLSGELCGNGITDKAVGENCDDGEMNGQENHCDNECTARVGCGNNLVESNEDCDSGKMDSAACDRDCTAPVCGDGHINAAAGETCDPQSNAGCNINCTPSVCGDGIVNSRAGEECDSGQLDESGNAKETSFCDADCTVPRCGDRTVNKAAGEECDPGENPNCDSSCKSITDCGDSFVDYWRGEVCDDGNNDNCGSCNEGCTRGQGMNRANGKIITLDPDRIADADSFSVKLPSTGGGTTTLVFEFEKDGDGVSSTTHTKVDIKGLDESYKIASRIAEAIRGKESESGVSVSKLQSINVDLQHRYMGSIGNATRITTTSDGLYVTGMSEGTGVGCATGVGCKSDWDCKSGKCESGKCK